MMDVEVMKARLAAAEYPAAPASDSPPFVTTGLVRLPWPGRSIRQPCPIDPLTVDPVWRGQPYSPRVSGQMRWWLIRGSASVAAAAKLFNEPRARGLPVE